MAVVVDLGGYRVKGVLTAIRELFVLASKGKIAGVRVDVAMRDGSRKKIAAGTVVQGGEDEEDCAAVSGCARRMRE